MDTLDPEQLQSLAASIKTIAEQAGEAILQIYNTEFAVERKQDKSPVTEADLAAHRVICKALDQLEYEYPVLSEESATIDYSTRKQWPTYWLVDPLDGTREFIKRNGEFTVNIALIHHHQPVLGVVYVPVTEVAYLGIDQQGAYKFQEGQQDKITTRRLNLDNIAVAGSRSHGNQRQQDFIQRLGQAEILAVGSSLKFCLVAEGRVDIYPRFGPTSEWDTAAAQCVVEQAGGRVVTHQMESLSYNKKDSLLNPEFFAIGDDTHDWPQYL